MLSRSKAAVLGGGAYGTALAQALARAGLAAEIVVIEHFSEVVDAINRDHRNERFLPGVALSPRIRAAGHGSAIAGAAAVFLAAPTGHADRILRDASPDLDPGAVVVVGTKGFWGDPPRRGDEAARRAAPGQPVATMGGGGLAGEMGPGLPTLLVVGGEAPHADAVAGLLRGPSLIVETTADAAGVALCAALKNVYALGMAILEGPCGDGENWRGAFFSLAIGEMGRWCATLGGRAETAYGPAGLGDLVTTALSARSRNRRLGGMLAAGMPLAAAIGELRHRPEGLDALAFTAARPEGDPARFPLLHAIAAALEGDLRSALALFGLQRGTG